METLKVYMRGFQHFSQMKKAPGRPKKSEAIIKDVKRRTKRQFNPEEKIAIVLEGMSGDESIAAICRREGIAQSVYYSWSKAFMEAGKARLNGDTKREADSSEVAEMRKENAPSSKNNTPIALEDDVLDFDVVAYPNPYVETFTIDFVSDFDENVTIMVHNMNGQVVEQYKDIDPMNNPDMGRGLPAGMYFVTVTQSGQTKTVKVNKFK